MYRNNAAAFRTGVLRFLFFHKHFQAIFLNTFAVCHKARLIPPFVIAFFQDFLSACRDNRNTQSNKPVLYPGYNLLFCICGSVPVFPYHCSSSPHIFYDSNAYKRPCSSFHRVNSIVHLLLYLRTVRMRK